MPFLPYPSPIFDKYGRLIGAVNLPVDLTEIKRGEDEAILDRIRRGKRVGTYETIRRAKDGTLINVVLTSRLCWTARGASPVLQRSPTTLVDVSASTRSGS